MYLAACYATTVVLAESALSETVTAVRDKSEIAFPRNLLILTSRLLVSDAQKVIKQRS